MAGKLTLELVNSQLKSANIRVRVCTVSGKNTLFLRATLPPRPGSDRGDTPYQQRIALGAYNTDAGLRYAKAEALRLAGLLDSHQFNWESYLPQQEDEPSPEQQSCLDWVKKFEEEFWARGDRLPVTWKDYRKVFKHLPENEPLTFDLAKGLIIGTKANTKSRERYTDKLASLCEFAGIENASDLRRYRGTYSQRGKDTPLIIPSYQEIFDSLEGFTSDRWRLAFCFQAAFGLRNHEIYHLSFDKMDKGLLVVGKNTKTGWRVVPSCHPEWVDNWGLKEAIADDLPQSSLTDNDELGRQVWKAYKRAGVKFPPYSLRHRFACDCAIQNKPLALAANVMGHSVITHTKIYHAYLPQNDLISAWK